MNRQNFLRAQVDNLTSVYLITIFSILSMTGTLFAQNDNIVLNGLTHHMASPIMT